MGREENFLVFRREVKVVHRGYFVGNVRVWVVLQGVPRAGVRWRTW